MRLLSCSIIQLFLLLQLQTLFVSSQNIVNGYVPVGKSITASESQQLSISWRSPSGDFGFGFRKIKPNNGFTLSIWFDKIRDKTIIWHAQVNTTTGLVPNGSKVTLTAARGLVLTDPRGQELWRSSLPPRSGSVSRARITDAGKFFLITENSGKELWSSFGNPTDTMLPTQSIEVNGSLSSRQTETSFTKGKFRLRLGDDGDLQLLVPNSKMLADANNYLSYYASKTNGTRLVFNQSGYMYVVQKNNSRFYIKENEVPKPSRDFYLRAVLHFDGVFALYHHPKGQENSGWTLDWSVPDNICASSSGLRNVACGFNNVCSLGDNKRPKCQCPGRFSLMDTNDEYGDCKPDFEMPNCGEMNNKNTNANADVNLYEFIRLNRTNFYYGDYELHKNYDEERCKDACFKDCFCAAVVFGVKDLNCWKKTYPFSNGQRSLYGGVTDTVALIKVPKTATDVPTEKKKKTRDWLIIACSILLGISALVNFIFAALYTKKNLRQKNTGAATATTTANELNMRVFTYRELVVATGDFIEELGRGAFGIVYKGILKGTGDSEVIVAVKKLDRLAQENEKEFKNEVKAIGQTHNKNLVRLIGFCNEGQNRLIVYEFLPHGTLADYLFMRPRPIWDDRKRIAVGIARGILYLHEECSEQIIHCDIKPQNILLDENYYPRISDFGLAKLLMMNQTHTLTNIRGTKGYVAAEWFRNSPITSKVDVYSYGVMLLEIVCCKKAVDLEDSVILIDWAYDCFRQGRLDVLIEDDLEAIEDIETVEKYVKIAIWCIQEEPGMRPNMRNVTQMLEGVAQVHDPPNPSPYSTLTWYSESLSIVPMSLV